MAKSIEDIDAWARAYVEVQQEPKRLTSEHPLWWAVRGFMDLILERGETEPDDCWRAILRVLELEPPDKVISILAAGPLEDLIGRHGPQFIDRIETESRRNPKFRHLLGGVWTSSECRGLAKDRSLSRR